MRVSATRRKGVCAVTTPYFCAHFDRFLSDPEVKKSNSWTKKRNKSKLSVHLAGARRGERPLILMFRAGRKKILFGGPENTRIPFILHALSIPHFVNIPINLPNGSFDFLNGARFGRISSNKNFGETRLKPIGTLFT